MDGYMPTIYETVLAQAEDRRQLRWTAARNKPFTRNMAISGLTSSTVSRPTEQDAVESIRRGVLVLSRTYKQDTVFPRKSAAFYIRTLENALEHSKRCRHCGDEKPKYEFSPDKRNKDGLQAYCKHCRMVIASESRRFAA